MKGIETETVVADLKDDGYMKRPLPRNEGD